jgi:hypothetical protein
MMNNHTAEIVASNAKKIYRQFETGGSGTSELEENTAFFGTFQERDKLVHVCPVKDWKKSLSHEILWPYKNTNILESGAWTATTASTISEYLISIDRPFDSSTSDEYFVKEDLSRIIRTIFEVGKNEQFEDGMKSNFSFAIENIIRNYQNNAIEMLSEFLASNKIDSDLLCETLRTLGNLHDDETELIRFQILIPYLSHASPFIRDCTGLALYDLKSPNAILYIKKAIDKEPYQSLKKDFKKILSELQEINSAQVDSAT